MTMIEEARRSQWKALKSLLVLLQQRLSDLTQQNQQGNSESIISSWKQVLRKVAKLFADGVLKPYGPEFRFLLVFWLEAGTK